MPRDYSAEYQASQLRAWRQGFRNEYYQRQQKRRIEALETHPGYGGYYQNIVKPWDVDQTQPGAKGIQGPFGPSPEPDWDYYWPTRTSNTQRPATIQARYSQRLQEMQIVFRDGTSWTYDNIDQGFWSTFKRAASPGKVIYQLWPQYTSKNFDPASDHGPGGWGSIVGEG